MWFREVSKLFKYFKLIYKFRRMFEYWMIGHRGSSYYGFSLRFSGLLHASDKFLSRADHDSCKYFILSIGKSKMDWNLWKPQSLIHPQKIEKNVSSDVFEKEKIKAGENLKKWPSYGTEILLNFHDFKIYFCGEFFFYSSNIHALSQIFIQYHFPLIKKGELYKRVLFSYFGLAAPSCRKVNSNDTFYVVFPFFPYEWKSNQRFIGEFSTMKLHSSYFKGERTTSSYYVV